ncbi:MAG: DUF4105 domain-containing protein [Ginsengibacter sp.]
MKFLLYLLFLLPFNAGAQNDSCRLRISLLTATPGDELYSTFGHSALRVIDSTNNTDIVYNYGTFNFDEPGFYTKFVRGKLMYFLSREYFDSFIYSYQEEHRGITEQVLNLSCAEKNKIVDLLYDNMMPANRFYKYDFTFDNCTTRLRDLIENSSDGQVHFKTVLNSPKTFRNLIHDYLDINDKQWSKLGIDILLGAKTDAVMTPREEMFLPDYLLMNFDSATLDNHTLVAQKKPVYAVVLPDNTKDNLRHPFFIFTCLFAFIAFFSFFKNPVIQKIMSSLDGLLFFVAGLLGILLVFMWFGTDHIMTKNNYNLLWAWPLNAVAAFYIHSKKKWVKIYYLVYAIFNLILLGVWFFLPQLMNPALIPIIGILIFRSFVYITRKH